jgi:hypothetical protein
MTYVQQLLGQTLINVTRSGEDDLQAIRDARFHGIRIPATMGDEGPPHLKYDLRAYLTQARQLGLKVLLLFDRDAYYWPDWRENTASYVQFWLTYYWGLYDAIEVGNEPDLESPASWTMSQQEFSELLRATRDAAGPNVTLVSGGLASGQPDWLRSVDLRPVNYVAIHPYAKDAPSSGDVESWPDVDVLMYAYRQVTGHDQIISEWGYPGDPPNQADQAQEAPEMAVWANGYGAPFCYFNWRDGGGEHFGLVNSDGSVKPALQALSLAIGSLPPVDVAPPEPSPEPEPEPTIDPYQWWTPQQIATAAQSPLANVKGNWPTLAHEMAKAGLWTQDDAIAAIGTVAIETAHTFLPIHEYGTPADWANYSGGSQYAGRGHPQLTHDYNYDACGKAIGLNLVLPGGNPDLLLQTGPSAQAFSWYYSTHGVPSKDGTHYYTCQELAAEPDYYWFRVAWSGGSRGADEMAQIRAELLGATVPTDDRSYIDDVPDSVVLQYPEDWTCSIHSTAAVTYALEHVAGAPQASYDTVYGWMVPSICSSSLGLHAADGHELVALLLSKGYRAQAIYPAQLHDAQTLAGLYPLLIGGQAWYHWVMCKGVTAEGVLQLENPAPGYKGIYGELKDSWDRLGPMTVIAVEWPGGAQPGPQPPQPPGQPSYDELASLVGTAYADDGTIIPALEKLKQDTQAIINFLRDNNPYT